MQRTFVSARPIRRIAAGAVSILMLVVGAALYATPARASIVGEENVTLASILAQSIQQTVAVKKTLEFVRETTALARDTAGFARESVQVGKNLKMLLEHPGDFARHATHAWAFAFPELQDALANAIETRRAVRDLADPSDMDTYDPYAYVRMYDRLRSATGNAFEAMAYSVDFWDVNASHDAMLDSLVKQHDIAVDNLERLAWAINTSTLSPVQASVHTAQSSAVSAAAQVEAAATLQRMSRTQELQMMHQLDAATRQQQAYDSQMDAAMQMFMPSWDLDPMGQRARPKGAP